MFFGLRIRRPSISEIKKNIFSDLQFWRTVFFRTDHKFPRGCFFSLAVWKVKQTIITVVILGMPYNFSIYIVLSSIIFTMQLVQCSQLCITQVWIDRDYHTMAAAGDGFIPSSLQNNRRKFAIPAKCLSSSEYLNPLVSFTIAHLALSVLSRSA
jgi:hypothetical protein